MGTILFSSLMLLYLLCPTLLSADMAIVRPFATKDQDRLIASFEPWESHIPCTTPPTTPVDLFVCFSQSYINEPILWAALQAFSAEFAAKRTTPGTWQSCFHKLYVTETNLLPEQDIYDSLLQSDPGANWVEGPNRQFLYMATAFQSGAWGHYEAWYLMEMDSIPIKKGWMTTLLEEVKSKAPFSILGSLFRSYRWNAFRETLPPSLLLHINGNAVYNCSHPVFHYFLKGLEEDASLGNFTVPFDVRISQLFLDSVFTEEEYNSFRWDSSSIGNYASTTMLHKYLTTETIVHGALFFAEWKEATALVVSDWGLPYNSTMTALEHFRYTLQHGQHPFREIIVMRPAGLAQTDPYTWPTTGGTMTITEQNRSSNNVGIDWLDWCNAEVQSNWFMYTNVNFDFGMPIDLMQDLTTPRPVASYINRDREYCEEECVFSLRRAEAFTGAVNGTISTFFLLKDIILNTNAVSSFCPAWTNWYQMQLQDPNTCNPIPGPTATDYMAYLTQQNTISDMYCLVDAVVWGQRDFGIPMADQLTTSSSECAFPVKTANGTRQCGEGTCVYNSGMGAPYEEVASPPAFHTTVRYPECTYGNWAIPFIVVQNDDIHPLTFELSLTRPFVSSIAMAIVQSSDSFTIELTATTPLPSQMSVAGNLTLVSLFTNFSISRLVPFAAYNIESMVVSVADTKLKVGDAIRITGNGAMNSIVQLLVPIDLSLGYLFPPSISNDWAQSADTVVPNVLALDTSMLPAQGITLTLVLRQLGTLVSGDTVGHCWNYTIDLVSNQQTPCSGTLTLNASRAQSGSTVWATLSSLISNFDLSDEVSYAWGFGTQYASILTTTPSVSLSVPYLLQSQGNVIMLNVEAEDTYGRVQTCSAPLTVMPMSTSDLQQVITRAGCASGGATPIDVSLCVQASAALFSQSPSDSSAEITLIQSLEAGMELSRTSVGETNTLLSVLAAVTREIPFTTLTDALQSYILALVHHLVTIGDVWNDSADWVAQIAGAVLPNAVAEVSASNAALAKENAMAVMTLVDTLLGKLVCQCSGSLYETKSAASEGCVAFYWGCQTSNSIAQDYGDAKQCIVPVTLENDVPASDGVVCLDYSYSCNPLRNDVQSKTWLRKFLVYNSETCEPYPIKLTNETAWSSPVSSPDARASRVVHVTQDKFMTQAIPQCFVLDEEGHQQLGTYDVEMDTCSSQNSGTLTSFVPPSTTAVTQENPTEVVGNKEVANDNGTRLAIAIGVGLGVGFTLFCVLVWAADLFYRHRRSAEATRCIFEVIPAPQVPTSYPPTPLSNQYTAIMIPPAIYAPLVPPTPTGEIWKSHPI